MEKCHDSNKKELLDTIRDVAAENCFIFGDIENFSLDSDFMDVWCIRKDDKITSILLRYYKYYVIYSTNKEDYIDIADVIKSDKSALGISALQGVADGFKDLLSFKKSKHLYLAELNKHTFKAYISNLTPKKATEEDIEELFQFQLGIEEFGLTEDRIDSFRKEITNGSGRVYLIKEENKIVSTATLTAENSLNGMIIGVATDPGFRRKGYAKTCVGTICKEMINENKSVLLFYDNPKAGILYKELGFVDINNWFIGEF